MTTPKKGGGSPARRKPRPPPKRFIRWLMRPPEDYTLGPVGTIRITVEGEDPPETDYFLRAVDADLPAGQRAYELTKLGTPGTDPEASSYTVILDGRAGDGAERHHSCECRGFLRWGPKVLCKHIAGLLCLLKDQPTQANPDPATGTATG